MKKYLFSLLLLLAMASHAQVPNTLSATDKVYGLSKFWQEVNYNFVYLDKVDRARWDNDYREAIMTVQKTKNDYEYYRALQKFCASLNDGHTNIYLPKTIDSLVYTDMFGKYRIFLTNIDNKAIVTRTNLSIKDEVPVGSEIIEVNGVPTAEHLKQNVLPYIASSTDYVLMDWAVKDMLKGLKGEKYDIKYRTPKGKVKSLTLTHARTSEQEVYPALEKRELLELKWYPNQTAYLALNGFHDPKINEMFLAKRLSLTCATMAEVLQTLAARSWITCRRTRCCMVLKTRRASTWRVLRHGVCLRSPRIPLTTSGLLNR